jgi:hypothetical protein
MIPLGSELSGAAFREWLKCIQPGRDGVLAMYKASIDESGTHQNAPVLCIAICVASADQWSAFEAEWGPVTQEIQRGYHAKRPECNPFNELLASLVVKHMEAVFAVSVSLPDFNAIVPQQLRSKFGGPYVWLLKSILYNCGHWCEQKKVRLAYVIEAGAPNWKAAQKQFERAMAWTDLRRAFGAESFTWVRKGNMVLHPPDLVSQEISSTYQQPLSPVGRILRERVLYFHHDAQRLQKHVDIAKATEREQKHKHKKTMEAYKEHVQRFGPFAMPIEEFFDRNFLPDELWSDDMLL